MRGEDVESEASYAESYFPRLNLGWSELRSLRREGWKYIAAPEPELYDLSSDPGELENLATDAPEKRDELAAELFEIDKKAVGPFSASPHTPDRQTLARLRSLGYVSSANTPLREGPLPDPKSRIGLWQALLKGVDHSDKAELDRAIVEFETILQQDSGMILVRAYLAEAYYKQGQYQAAANQCLKLLAVDPNDFQANNLLGESLARLGRAPEAEQAFEKAAELDTTAPGPLARLANLHLDIGNIAKARQVFDRAIERDSRDASVLLVQGKLLGVAGKPDEAEKALREALAANPLEVATHVQLTNLLIGLKRFGEAEELLLKGVAERPGSSMLHMTLGRVRAMSGRPERAIPSFQRALELAPESPMAMTSLGIAYLEIHADEKGVELLERSLELNPNQPEIRSFLKKHRSQ